MFGGPWAEPKESNLRQLHDSIMGEHLFEELELAKLYEQFRLGYKNIGLEKEILSYLTQSLKGPYSYAVDVGCGTGHLTRVLAPHFKKVVGVDVSQAQIQVAREVTEDSNVEYRVGPAEDLSFLEDGCVELVTAAASIHYFDTKRFFEEVDRVLKPGGCLAVISVGRMDKVLTLTPVTENQDVLDRCDALMKEIFSFVVHSSSESAQTVLKDGHPTPENYKEVHRFEATAQKVGSIDILVGILNTSGVLWKIRKENPEKDPVDAYKKRFLEIFREISATPEEVQVTLTSVLGCSLHRKPV